MTVSSFKTLLAGLGAVLGALLLAWALAVFTRRLSLVVLILAGSAVLLWASFRAHRSLGRIILPMSPARYAVRVSF